MKKRKSKQLPTMSIKRLPTEKAAETYAEKQLKTVVTDDIHVMKIRQDGPPEGVTILKGVKRPAVITVRDPELLKRAGLRITRKTPRLR
jgi:hypothetical protein